MAAVITRADEPGAVPRTVFFGLLNDVASDPQVTDLAEQEFLRIESRLIRTIKQGTMKKDCE